VQLGEPAVVQPDGVGEVIAPAVRIEDRLNLPERVLAEVVVT
jgi:hypothetical protein